MPTDNDYLRQIAAAGGGGGGSGLTQGEVQAAVEAAIVATLLLPSEVHSGSTEVSGSPTLLTFDILPNLGRGVHVQLPFDEVFPVFIGPIDGGHQLLPGESIFLQVLNIADVSVVSPVTGKDSVTVFWWAS